jgi:hypothetical protein
MISMNRLVLIDALIKRDQLCLEIQGVQCKKEADPMRGLQLLLLFLPCPAGTSTFGNAAELIITITAIRAGQIQQEKPYPFISGV